MVIRAPILAFIFVLFLSFTISGVSLAKASQTAEEYLKLAKSYEEKIERQKGLLASYESDKKKYEKMLARPYGHKHKTSDPSYLRRQIRHYEEQIQKTQSKINKYEELVKNYRAKAKELQKKE